MRIDEFSTPDGSITESDRTLFCTFGFNIDIILDTLVQIETITLSEYNPYFLDLKDYNENEIVLSEYNNMSLKME